MTILLRTLIKEILNEAFPSQHPQLKSKDLIAIGECLIEKLENIGFKITRASSSFNSVYTFEIEKDKSYLVTIKKSSKNHITEDSSVEYFRRDNPELSAFLKKAGNKNYSVKQPQATTSVNQTSKKSGMSYDDHDENDDTHYGSDAEIFKFKTSIQYVVTAYDKSKNGNTLFDVKQNMLTSYGKNPQEDDDFDYFVDEICEEVVQKLKNV